MNTAVFLQLSFATLLPVMACVVLFSLRLHTRVSQVPEKT